MPTNKNRKEQILKNRYRYIKSLHKQFKGKVITFEEYRDLVLSPCHYCGTPYSIILPDRQTKNGEIISKTTVKVNGIDRLSSYDGYTKENSVPACGVCNCAKNDLSLDQFTQVVKRQYKYMKSKGLIDE